MKTVKRLMIGIGERLIATLAIALVTMALGCTSAGAVTNAEIRDALIANGASPSLAQAGANLSSNIEDRSGNPAIYNGSCCTGLMQLTATNIRNYCNCTPTQYGQKSTQEQTAIWMRLTTDNFNSEAIRRLNGMTTFDGQAVDDAFKLACVQLGPGHCKDMLDSGSCSGFADRNGTTICRMATAIRGNSTNIGNTMDTSGGGTQGGGNVQGTDTPNQLTMAMGNPAYCWSCDVIVYSMGFSEAIMTAGFPVVFNDLSGLLLILLGIGFLNSLAVSMISGDSLLRPIRTLFPRLFLAVFLLGLGTSVVMPFVVNDMLVTTLTTGSSLGNSLARSAASSLNINLENTTDAGTGTTAGNNDCIYASSAVVRLNLLVPAESQILSLACTIHHAATTQLQIAVFMMGATGGGILLDPIGMAYSAMFVIVGGIMAATTILTMLRYGLIIMDLVMTMSVFVVMTPYMIFASVFPSTRQSTTKFLTMFLHAFMMLTFSGIAAVVAILLVLSSIQFGLGQEASVGLDPAQLLAMARQVAGSINTSDRGVMGPAALLALACLGGSMASHRVLAAIPELVHRVTGIKISSALSTAAVNAVMGFTRAAMGGGTVAVSAVAAPTAGAAGRALGRMFGR